MVTKSWQDVIGPQRTIAPLAARRSAEPAHTGFAYQRVYEWRDYPAEPPIEKYRDDPADPESPILEREVRWWSPLSVGFRARILVNPLGGEVRQEVQRYFAWISGEQPEEEHLKAIANRVSVWDYVMVDDEGNRVDVPPPSSDPEDGWQQFLELPNDVLIWLKDEIRNAHFPKDSTRSSKRAGPTDSPTPISIDPALEPLESS